MIIIMKRIIATLIVTRMMINTIIMITDCIEKCIQYNPEIITPHFKK